MTWKQSSNRKFNLANKNTQRNVGPRSYNVMDTSLDSRYSTISSQPRLSLKIQEFNTPGPDYYNTTSMDQQKYGEQNSFFRSQTN